MVKVRQCYGDKLNVLKEARASKIVEIIVEDDNDDYNHFIPYQDDDEGHYFMPKRC